MRYQRGEIIEVPVPIPGKNRTEIHPAIIISNEDVFNNEEIYICLMITHSTQNDLFAYPLKKEMFISERTAPEGSIKTHLIFSISEKDIISNHNSKKSRMKSTYIDRLVDFMTTVVFLEE